MNTVIDILPRPTLSALALVLSFAAGCGDSTDQASPWPPPAEPEPPGPTTPAPRTPLGTSLFLEVIDPDGRPIPRARVTIPTPPLPPGSVGVSAFDPSSHLARPVVTRADGVEYRTDSAGHLLLEELEHHISDRVVLRVEAVGYAPASVVREDVSPGAHMGARVVLVPVVATAVFDAARGGHLEHEGARVEIPAQAVVTGDGEPVMGLVELHLVPFAATERALEHPGPLSGTDAGGREVSLETYAMAEVSLWQGSRQLQLAPGALARLTLPLPDSWLQDPDPARRPAPGDVVPAWWFDLDEGRWREEGAGTVVADPSRPGALSWIAEVGHFTWWNMDEPWTDHSCFLVTVHKDGAPLQGVTVEAVGLDYEGDSKPVITDAQGQACTAIKLGHKATIYVGGKLAPLIPPFVIQGADQAAACDGNGEACQGLPIDLGDDDKDACSPGDSYACAYSGPPGSEDIGICHAGFDFCGADMQWIGCEGEVLPQIEDPLSDEDEDCNTDPHNGEDVPCDPKGLLLDCYDGPPGTLDVGICHAGNKLCDGVWLACEDQQEPDLGVDDCLEPDIDSDCDGHPACGHAEWAQAIGDADDQHLAAVAVAADGLIYALGRFRGTLGIGKFKLVNPDPEPHAFIARFMPDGKSLEPVDLGSALVGELELDVRGVDDIYVLGTLRGEFTVPGCAASTPVDEPDGLLLRLDATLACQSRRQLGGDDGPQYPSGLAVGAQGVYVTGAFGGTVAGLVTPINQDGVFLLAYDFKNLDLPPFVQQMYLTTWGANEPSRPALDASADGYALALVNSSLLTLGNQAFSVSDPTYVAETLLARFKPDGEVLWAAELAEHVEPPLPGFGIALDSAGRVDVAYPVADGLQLAQWAGPGGPSWADLVPGANFPAPQLGGRPLVVDAHDEVALHASVAGNPAKAFVGRWDGNGLAIWAHVYGGVAPTDGLAAAFSDDLPYPRVIVTGRQRSDIVLPLALNLPLLAQNGPSDGYLARLDP